MKSRLLLAAALVLILAAPVAASSHDPLTVDDVVRMSREGVSASVIIAEIESSHSYFDLSTDDILELTDEGVPQSVIEAMVRTSEDDNGDSGDNQGDYSNGYSSGYDGGYRTGNDWQYRYSFAVSLGYYDPWFYYYPFSAYYVACYPYYRFYNYCYYPFNAYDPWYYQGYHHYWYRSYPYDAVRVATGGRHSWNRGPAAWGHQSPSYVTNRIHGRTMYSRGTGVIPRTGDSGRRKPPVYTPPRGNGRRPVSDRPAWQRERPTYQREPSREPSGYSKPPSPPAGNRSRGEGAQGSGRNYGGRSGGGRSR